MKKDMNLNELVEELQLEKEVMHDYVVPTKLVQMGTQSVVAPDSGEPSKIARVPIIIVPDTQGGRYEPNEVFHQHLSQKLNIPAPYYRRMLQEAPELLAKNVNEWLGKEGKNASLVRTFEYADRKIARGMLSDRYNRMDNYDILFTALKAIAESGAKVEVREANVTDKRLYINIVAPGIEVESVDALRGYLRDSNVGDGIITGLTITNSEVGFGSFEIRPRVVVKKCMNGMIIKDDSFRKIHLGGKLSSGEIQWSERTQQKNLALIMSQTTDAIKQFLSEDYLNGVVRKLEDAARVKFSQPVDALQNAVREIGKSVNLSEENKKNILNYFVSDGDTSGAGIVQAVTREAQNLDADNRYEAETAAFAIMPQLSSFDKPFIVGKN